MSKRRDLEIAIWAAAYAASFQRDLAFRHDHGHGGIDDIRGFQHAEVADVFLEKAREALEGEDGGYLIPIKEDWNKDRPVMVCGPSRGKKGILKA